MGVPMPDFTTLAKVKVALAITKDGDDTNITALIPQATAIIETLLKRTYFASGSAITEYPTVPVESDSSPM